MSDPVTNAEVEDVLSSIRRLVSEDKRPLQTREPSAGADRLVLTPALRVEDTDKDDAGSASDAGWVVVAPAAVMTQAQDTIGETARQMFDPSDDLPVDAYKRSMDDTLTTQEETEEDEEDAPTATSHDDDADAGAMAEVAGMPSVAFSHAASKPAAADSSDAPYKLSNNTLDDQDTDGLNAASDEDDTPVADDTATLEGPSNDNDMFDFESLRRRDPSAPMDVETAETEVAENTPLPKTETPTWAVATPDLTTQDASDDAVADAPDADREAGLVAATKAATLSAKIAALETAIGNIADTWEPDTLGADDYSGTDQPAMTWEDDVSRDATGVPLRSEAAQAAWQDANPDVVMIGTARAAVIAAAAQENEQAKTPPEPEVVDQAAADQAAKDRAIAAARAAAADRVAMEKRAAADREAALAKSAEAAKETAPAAAAAAAPEATEEAAPADEDRGETVPAQTAGALDNDYIDEGQMLDEEALRDIVSEIVRSELQGALGERITRNVRKLVRREIHRALTAQELE